jgi:hypothetical protein
MAASPSTSNYYLGKGVVSFRPTADSVFRDLGDVQEMTITLTVERLDHFSQRSGVRNKDKSVILEKGGTVSLRAHEWSEENLKLALLGDENSDGDIEIFAVNAIEGELKFVSGNEIGPTFTLVLDNVSFVPGEGLSFVGDDWGDINLSGEILSVAGLFGRLQSYADGAA